MFLARIYVFLISFGYWACMWRGGGVSQGMGTQPANAVFHSKFQCFNTYIFDVVATKNDHPKYVKHVLGNIYVFSILFGYWVRMCGGGVSKMIGTQLANAVFHHGQLKNLMFRNFFFLTT